MLCQILLRPVQGRVFLILSVASQFRSVNAFSAPHESGRTTAVERRIKKSEQIARDFIHINIYIYTSEYVSSYVRARLQ